MKVNNILKILVEEYPLDGADDVCSDIDRIAADSVKKFILEIKRTGKIPQNYVDLYIKGSDEIDDSSDSDENDENLSDEDYDPESEKEYRPLSYSLSDMKRIINLYDDTNFTGNRFKRVSHSFKYITNKTQIRRIREQINNYGNRTLKLRELDKQLFDLFSQWKNEKHVIRDRFLVEAALEIADKLHLEKFKASNTWLLKFKKRHRIVGRKITKMVTVKSSTAEAVTDKEAKEFVEHVKQTVTDKRTPPKKLFNADQMGIQLEITSGRTLCFKGEKHVEAVVQNKNATTHTLTIQPLINAAGKLCVPVLTCFYEPKGAPDCFKRDLQNCKNLHAVWTTSGKVTSQKMKDWMKDEFLSNALTNSILLLDSWSGFNQAKEIEEVKNKKIYIVTIPKGSTGKIQPLDVGFNRYFKAFYRTMSDKIRRNFPDFKLAQRKNMGILLNQTVEQFCAPRYSSMIQHAFIKSGYCDNEYEAYQTPDKYCFDYRQIGAKCEKRNCSKFAFIRCSWCEKFICFEDFLIKLHCCCKNKGF